MDLQGNDCPCKRQRVSEGDDIDQETGMCLDDASGSQEIEVKTEKLCEPREITSNQKGDSAVQRETIHSDTFVGAAGDCNSNLVDDGNHSIENVTQSNRNDKNAQSTENQTESHATGSQVYENLTEVKNCSFASNGPSGMTQQKVQSNTGFCEYVQNVQAMAENSYIRNRERNTSRALTDMLQKLESPKLKRPIDRVNTNLAKKKTEALPSSIVREEELTGLDDTDKTLSPTHQLEFKSQSVKSDIGNEIDDKDRVEFEVGKKPESDKVTNVDTEANARIDDLESACESSIDTSEEMSNNPEILSSKETQSSNRTRNMNSSHGEGFDVSCFVEMFSNSVMGNIMSGVGKASSLRYSGKHINKKETTESKKTSTKCKPYQCQDDSKRLVLKDEVKGGDKLRFSKEDKTRTHTYSVDEIFGANNIEDEADNSSDICKFQGLGGVLSDIAGVGDSGKLEARGVDSTSSGPRVHESSDLGNLVEASDTCNTDFDIDTLNTLNSQSHPRHFSACLANTNKQSSHSIAKESNKDKREITDKEINNIDDNEAGNSGVIVDSVSTLINGRFELSYDETQEIVNEGNINKLPITVLVQILKNLTAFQLLRRASCVCKYWYNLCRDPDIWRSVYLVNQHRLTDFDFKRILQFSDYRVRCLNLTDSRFITNNGIRYLIMSCPLLEELRVMRCFDLTDVAFDGLSSVGVCSNLQALYMDGCCRITDKTVLEVSKACPQLRILNLNQCTRISDTSITRIAQNCPKLTTLQLDHCSQVTDEALCEIVLGCPNILYMNLMSCGITDTGVKYLARLTKLSNLDLSNIPRLTSESVIYMSKFCKHLQCINVSLNTVMDDRCIAELAKNLPVLKRLYCVSCSISDKGLEDIAKYCPNLESLDVGWCQDVSDSGVRVISLACKHLDYFGLIRCDKVTLETIEELVLKYPSINYSTFILESRRLLERARNEGYQFKL